MKRRAEHLVQKRDGRREFLRATKLAINQALDAQGFTAHIYNAHSTYIVRRLGASDPGYVLPKPASGKRQPMVQVALERYQRDQQRRQGGAGEQAAPSEPSKD